MPNWIMQERQRWALQQQLSLVSLKHGTITHHKHTCQAFVWHISGYALTPTLKNKGEKFHCLKMEEKGDKKIGRRKGKRVWKESEKGKKEKKKRGWRAGRLRCRQRKHINCCIEDKLFNPLSEGVEQGRERDREGFHFCSTFIKLFISKHKRRNK